MILLTTDPSVIIQTITDYPYIGAAAVFLLCGLGLPIPEEVVLLAAGFVCAKFPDKAQLFPMMGWCAAAIVAGDSIPPTPQSLRSNIELPNSYAESIKATPERVALQRDRATGARYMGQVDDPTLEVEID